MASIYDGRAMFSTSVWSIQLGQLINTGVTGDVNLSQSWIAGFCYLFKRTNEVYLPINGVNTDWLPVEAEAHQSWPSKKETGKLTKRERQRKKEKKTKYIVIHKIAAEKYKRKAIDTRITSPRIRPHTTR